MERDPAFKSIICLLGIIQTLCFSQKLLSFPEKQQKQQQQQQRLSSCFSVSNSPCNHFQISGLENSLL